MILKVIWSGTPTYKRILLRQVPWFWCSPRNLKFWFKIYSAFNWYCNINILFFGFTKCNQEFVIRFFNIVLECGW